MGRLLLWILGACLLLWWTGLLRPRRPSPRPSAAAGSAPIPSRGKMVRDRICNTFLPAGRALVARQDGEDHFFCSAACRDRFLAGETERP